MSLPLLGDDLYDRLRSNLAAHDRLGADGGGLRHAAVALAVVAGDAGEACYLLTRRVASLSSHGGQWALPGGGIDEGEGPAEAAQRELHEEVGIAGGEVLGLLDDYPTRSGFLITPVVVWCGEVALAPNPHEVAAVYRVPLAELLRPDAPQFVEHAGVDEPLLKMPVFDHALHAPTAAVLYQFAEVALRGRTTRVAHFDQPPFAWR